MLRKSPMKKSFSSFSLLLVSLIAGTGLGIPTYIVFDWYSRTNPIDNINIIIFATFFTIILYMIIFIISGILLNILSQQHAHAKELKNFKNFTDVLHRSTSEIEVYETLYNFVRNMHLANHVTLFYRNDRSTNDVVWQRITNERMPLCSMEPRNCPIIKYGRDCCVRNIATDITCAYQLPEHKSGSYICLPITDGNQTLGILQLYSKSRYFFNDTIISKLKSYIEVAKPIISSKRALHQLSKKASTDKLTKLYNRSFLEPFLENQIEATSMSHQNLSVIMMDIDHFKKVNDTYGHAAGDAVLVVFSQVILRCLRRTDLVARYGGEEFIAILPSTDTETAISIAERIRETVATEPMPKVNDVDLPYISCSLGVSTYPMFADNKANLIKTADIALYKAKQSGRNRVMMYSKDMGM
ncbi:MAG: sensor domain-containing diguanylate cyclase [Bacillota bacterium]